MSNRVEIQVRWSLNLPHKLPPLEALSEEEEGSSQLLVPLEDEVAQDVEADVEEDTED